MSNGKSLFLSALIAACFTSADLKIAECRGRCIERGFSEGILIKDRCFCADPLTTPLPTHISPLIRGMVPKDEQLREKYEDN